MPPTTLLTLDNSPLIPLWVLLFGFRKAQIRLVLKACYRLAFVHEKAVQIFHRNTLPRLKSGYEIPFTELRLCAYHAKALKNALILDLFSLRVGACVPVPDLSGKLILELPQLVLQMPV